MQRILRHRQRAAKPYLPPRTPVVGAMHAEETVIAPNWLLFAPFSTRTTGICEREGVWSMILDGPAVTTRSFDEAHGRPEAVAALTAELRALLKN
jgi:hypothetical protein